jgi:hypothetical protein
VKFFKFVVLLSFSFALSGCDNRKAITSNQSPFSVGGIAIGMNKSDLEPKHNLLSCNPDADNKAKCYVNDTNFRYDFFGASVQFC